MWTEIVIVNVLLSKQGCSIIGRECNGIIDIKLITQRNWSDMRGTKHVSVAMNQKENVICEIEKMCLLHYKMIWAKKKKKVIGVQRWSEDLKWLNKSIYLIKCHANFLELLLLIEFDNITFEWVLSHLDGYYHIKMKENQDKY